MAKRQYILDSSPPSHPLLPKRAIYRLPLRARLALPTGESEHRAAIAIIQNASF